MANSSLQVYNNGSYTESKEIWVYDDNRWKIAKEIWAHNGITWKKTKDNYLILTIYLISDPDGEAWYPTEWKYHPGMTWGELNCSIDGNCLIKAYSNGITIVNFKLGEITYFSTEITKDDFIDTTEITISEFYSYFTIVSPESFIQDVYFTGPATWLDTYSTGFPYEGGIYLSEYNDNVLFYWPDSPYSDVNIFALTNTSNRRIKASEWIKGDFANYCLDDEGYYNSEDDPCHQGIDCENCDEGYNDACCTEFVDDPYDDGGCVATCNIGQGCWDVCDICDNCDDGCNDGCDECDDCVSCDVSNFDGCDECINGQDAN